MKVSKETQGLVESLGIIRDNAPIGRNAKRKLTSICIALEFNDVWARDKTFPDEIREQAQSHLEKCQTEAKKILLYAVALASLEAE